MTNIGNKESSKHRKTRKMQQEEKQMSFKELNVSRNIKIEYMTGWLKCPFRRDYNVVSDSLMWANRK